MAEAARLDGLISVVEFWPKSVGKRAARAHPDSAAVKRFSRPAQIAPETPETVCYSGTIPRIFEPY
jgi:hypothetical protein